MPASGPPGRRRRRARRARGRPGRRPVRRRSPRRWGHSPDSSLRRRCLDTPFLGRERRPADAVGRRRPVARRPAGIPAPARLGGPPCSPPARRPPGAMPSGPTGRRTDATRPNHPPDRRAGATGPTWDRSVGPKSLRPAGPGRPSVPRRGFDLAYRLRVSPRVLTARRSGPRSPEPPGSAVSVGSLRTGDQALTYGRNRSILDNSVEQA